MLEKATNSYTRDTFATLEQPQSSASPPRR